MTSIAAKNGSVIVKDGSVGTDCGCCGGWYCYNTQCDCPLVVAEGKIYLPISVTLTDGMHTFSSNGTTCPPRGSAQAMVDAYGIECIGASVSNPYDFYDKERGNRAAGYSWGVGGGWTRYTEYPPNAELPLFAPRPKCCGDITLKATQLNVTFSCLQNAWAVSWVVVVTCAEWRANLYYGAGYVSYPSYSDQGSFLVNKNGQGLPAAGTHSLATGSPSPVTLGGPACDFSFISGASMTIL